MTLVQLQKLLDENNFHHATYRDHGTIWEGLYVYAKGKGPVAFRGFILAGCFPKGDSNIEAAYALVRNSGVSLTGYY